MENQVAQIMEMVSSIQNEKLLNYLVSFIADAVIRYDCSEEKLS